MALRMDPPSKKKSAKDDKKENMKMDDYLAKIKDAYGVFWQHAPMPFEEGYVLTRWQGVQGTFSSLTIEDFLKRDTINPEHPLIEYKLPSINGKMNGNGNSSRVPIFMETDFYKFGKNGGSDVLDKEVRKFSKDNIMGFIAERIAWELTHHWLSLIDLELEQKEYKENYIFDFSDRYILKVSTPPRVLLLEKRKLLPREKVTEKFRELRDLDGLILGHHMDENYVIVIESKTENYPLNLDKLETSLLAPIREIYPNSKLIYVLFSDMGSLYHGGNDMEARQSYTNMIKNEPIKIQQELLEKGVGTVFFGFREGYETIEDLAEHIMKLRKLYFKMPVMEKAKVIRDKEIVIFSGKQPQYILSYEGDGVWREKRIKDRKH